MSAPTVKVTRSLYALMTLAIGMGLIAGPHNPLFGLPHRFMLWADVLLGSTMIVSAIYHFVIWFIERLSGWRQRR